MRDTLYVSKVNEVYARVNSEPSIAQELCDQLTFTVPGAKFIPAVRNKFWDGKIRLYNTLTGLVYFGLIDEVKNFADMREYLIEIDDQCLPANTQLTDKQIYDFFISLNLTLKPRDYQINAIKHGIKNDRCLFLSPTSSGKSLIIYLLTRFYNLRTLIIVPTTSLVSQLYTDFQDYGYDSEQYVHKIYGGADKSINKLVTVSTWQSIYKLPKSFFDQFDVVIGDEAHLFKAKSLTTVMEKLVGCKYRFGFTGTLDGSVTNKMTLEGLFGSVNKVITTSELIEQKYAADLKIKSIILGYDEDTRKLAKNFSYQDEMDFLVRHPKRNKFLRNLALSTDNNTLILFQYVEKHGRMLYNMMRDKDPDRPIYFIYGGIDADQREEVRHLVEKNNNAIIVASYGTFSTGVNIRNLHNVIFSSPTKSRVRTLQSIGRGLRIADLKTKVTVYDIADDLKYKTHVNFTLLHFMERLNIYNSENYEYKIFNANI